MMTDAVNLHTTAHSWHTDASVQAKNSSLL